MSESLNFWENYYSNHQIPTDESFFARFVIPFLNEGDTLFEIGCGNGRDSVFFAKQGMKVTAFDQCEKEVGFLNDEFSDLKDLLFKAGDFTNLGEQGKVKNIYSRFSLHSVALEKEINTLNWASRSLEENGLFFIEVRSVFDELCGEGTEVAKNSYVTDHYRRFLEIEPFAQRLEEAGFKILYKLQSKGLAPYKTEDPVVIRIIAQKL
jgi:SAM-dependent methyltransferase